MTQLSAPSLLQAVPGAGAASAATAIAAHGASPESAENGAKFAAMLDLSAQPEAAQGTLVTAGDAPGQALLPAISAGKDGNPGKLAGKILPVAGMDAASLPESALAAADDALGEPASVASADARSEAETETDLTLADLALADLPQVPSLAFLMPLAVTAEYRAAGASTAAKEALAPAVTQPLASAISPVSVEVSPASVPPVATTTASEAVTALRLSPVALVAAEPAATKADPLTTTQRIADRTSVAAPFAAANAVSAAKENAQSDTLEATTNTVARPAAPSSVTSVASNGSPPSDAATDDQAPVSRTAEPAMRRAEIATADTAVQAQQFAPAITAGPASLSTPEAAAPATGEPVEGPQDFATLVSRLSEAREAASPQLVRTALNHAQFGQVSLQFRHDDGGLAVTMASSDPDFTGVVQNAAMVAAAAGAQAQADTPRDGQQTQQQSQQQQHQSAQQSAQQSGASASNAGGQGLGQSGAQSGSQARAGEDAQRTGTAAPRTTSGQDAAIGESGSPARGGGIYA